jgi:hypothetical protein
MGRALGELRPGSLATRLLHNIRQAQAPLGRQALARLFPKERHQLGRALDRLSRAGAVFQDEEGRYRPGDGRRYRPQPVKARADLTAGPGLVAQLARIVDRAHAYRRAGAPCLGAALLERAAEKRLPAHITQDLKALASLFAAHRELFPQVDPGRAAA